MMFFHKMVLAILATASVTALAACSNDSEDDATTKHRAQAACEHMNQVCSTVQGFQSQDCSGSQATYEKLNDSDKLQTDLMIPCVMAAKTCEPAIDCIRPPPSRSTSTTDDETNEKKTSEHDPEDACEHINEVCANEDGFRNQDCSGSNAAYERLSASDKEIADAITPCIMGAKSCKSAFQCLKVD